MANSIRIYKSKQAEALDAQFSGSAEQLRAVYTAAIDHYDRFESRPLSDLVSELAEIPSVPWNPDTAQAFAAGWLADGQGEATRDAVLRHGYRDAFQLALGHEPPVPLETFWVTGAGDAFEVHISDGAERVTVFMIVPGVAGENGVPNGSTRASAKSWVVGAGNRTADTGRAAPQSLGAGEVVKVEVSGRNPDA